MLVEEDDGIPEGWFRGFALDDPALADGVLRHWQSGAGVAGVPTHGQGPPPDLRTAMAMLQQALVWIVDGPGAVRGSSGLLTGIFRMQGHLHELEARLREVARARVHAVLEQLQKFGSVEQLMRQAPAELCRCGFDRVMISQVVGSSAVPRVMHIPADPGTARELQQRARQLRFPLHDKTVETEMLRRPGALLVGDAQRHERVVPELLAATETRSYVAAPIVLQDVVIGFLHADCLVGQRMLDTFDRDLIGAFAQGFNAACQRALLLERLRLLRRDVRRGNASVLAVMDEFSAVAVDVSRPDFADRAVASAAAAMLVSSDARTDALLTRRELEVIELMAGGETNAQIARTLVISEGTVKSHVKHILRKLRARNRVEAVSRFALLSNQHPLA